MEVARPNSDYFNQLFNSIYNTDLNRFLFLRTQNCGNTKTIKYTIIIYNFDWLFEIGPTAVFQHRMRLLGVQ